MAVGADDGVLELGQQIEKGHFCIVPSLLLEQVGQLRRLAGHAGAGRRLVDALRVPEILEGVGVAPVFRVVDAEGHPLEVDQDLGLLD